MAIPPDPAIMNAPPPRDTSSFPVGPASWRLILGFFGALIAWVLLWVAILLLIFGYPLSILRTPERLPQLAISLYVMGLYFGLMTLVGVFWRRVARRPWSELGLRPSGSLLVKGLIFGLGSMVVLSACSQLLGWQHLARTAPWPPLEVLGALGTGLAFGFSEEYVFRGFFLRSLLRDLPRCRAILVSALLFAVVHFLHGNLHWQDLLAFGGLLMAGVVLALAAVKTGSLWLSIGIHAGWVWFLTVSGQLHLWTFAPAALVWTGGSTPTAGLLGMALMIPLGLAVSRTHA